MKTDLKAKYIQHLINKKNGNEGFTLIELLVVIIIIGILSAIALPSFLNQANKAKQSEAKTYVGSMNRGQQAYYTENSSFTSEIENLGVGVPTETTNYSYGITAVDAGGVGVEVASHQADSLQAALRGYVGGVYLDNVAATSEVTSFASFCEADAPGEADPGTIAPTDGACPAGYTAQDK